MPDKEHEHLLKRLEELERQSAQLDFELRRLKNDLLRHKSAAAGPPVAPAPPKPAPPPPAEAEEVVAPEPTAPTPAAVAQPEVAAAVEQAEAGKKREAIDVEFWLGGRGLLLIGVAAGVFAVGFFVKEAIERGWIGPLIRVLSGAGVGVVAVVVGDQIRARGYRIYGLWLGAGGFSAVYLSLWAGTLLYALLPTGVGFALMVVVVGAAAALGLLRDSESFVALAAVGGYLAPMLLRMESASVLFGLGYLGLLTGTGLWLAYREGWRYLAAVAILGGTFMALLSEGDPHLHGTYLALLVAGALVTAERRRWAGLAIMAAVFGWFALLLGSSNWEINAVSSCAYSAALAAAGLGIAARAKWAGLGAVTVAGGSLIVLSNLGAPDAHGVYLLALAAAALILARRERWVEIALLTIVVAWTALWFGRDGWNMPGLSFALYAGGLWLISLIASLGLNVSDTRAAEPSEESEEGEDSTAGEVDLIEAVRILLGPQVSGVLVTVLPPWLFYLYAMLGLEDSAYAESRPVIGFALGLVIGCVYLAQTIWGTRNLRATRLTWLAGLGYAFWLVAPSLLWEGAALARVFLLEGLAFVAAGVLLRTVEARAASLAAFVLAAMTYYGAAVMYRPELDAAFVGAWALTALALAVGLAVWGVAAERVQDPASWELAIRPIVLLTAAVLFLGWGTVEIQRFFELLGEGDRWNLARDLSISGFWMAYAAGLLVVGFWLKRPPVRWVGLGMALLAAGKVFLYDLSQLSQLYRIFSFVALAIVLLALSFRYQKLRGADKKADT